MKQNAGFIFVGIIVIAGTLLAQTPGSGDEHFDYRFGIPGTSYYQKNLCVDPRNGDVYVGGDEFTHAGTVAARNIAKWVRATGVWKALGAGVSGGEVKAMAVDPRNGDVYVAGAFTTAGGGPVNGIAKWNGTTWFPLAAGKSGITQITIDPNNGDVYVGGIGIGNGNVAKWNGSEWSTLGTGLNASANINAMVYHGPTNTLYVGGQFFTNDVKKIYGLAKWNGTTWDSVGYSFTNSSVNGSGTVNSIAIDGAAIYVGCNYVKVGNKIIQNLAKWDGASWTAIDTLLDESIRNVVVVNGEIYACGVHRQFQSSNSAMKQLAKFSNGKWEPLGFIAGFASAQIEQLAAFQNEVLVAGRQITGLGAVNVKNVGRYLTQTNEWAPLTSRFTLGIEMTNGNFAKSSNGHLYLAGNIRVPFSPGILRWNGNGWSQVGRGLYYGLGSLSEPVTIVAGENGDMYIGGKISFGLNADSSKVTANGIIKWNGTTNTWQSLGTGTYDNGIYALEYHNGKLYMGGAFTLAGNSKIKNLAVWDGTKWDSITSIGGTVRTITFAPNGHMVIGGQFTSLTGNSAFKYLAKWDGTQWDSLGEGANKQVKKVKYLGNTLYASGDFSSIGGKSIHSMAQWNGTQWDTVSSAIFGVNDFVFQGDTLFVSGTITGIGMQSNIGAGYFVNSQWTKMGTGFQNVLWYEMFNVSAPNTMFVEGQSVWCIGNYNIVGGRAAIGIARWNSFNAIASVKNTDHDVPGGYVLAQNYPNPFNPTTTIRFSIPSEDLVTVTVYDVVGRNVVLLANEKLKIGSYEVKFDASKLSSGVYFYQLRSGSWVETKKMFLIK
ncbi:MAG: T9SS type A sorting domain-containing protein [Bacteriovoracaceae bacterium]